MSSWSGSGAAEQVHEFTLTQDTYLRIDLPGSSYDTKMALAQGCPDGSTFCEYDDDGGPGTTSSLPCQLLPAGTC